MAIPGESKRRMTDIEWKGCGGCDDEVHMRICEEEILQDDHKSVSSC